jgi:hypothetical protein
MNLLQRVMFVFCQWAWQPGVEWPIASDSVHAGILLVCTFDICGALCICTTVKQHMVMMILTLPTI